MAFETKDATGRRLIDEPVLNSVIVLMVVNSVLGPTLTEQFGKRLASGSKPASPVLPQKSPAAA